MLCMHACVSAHMCVYAHMCVCVCVFECVCLCLYVCVCVHVCMHTRSSYLTVIGVHEMHGQMHPNYCQITNLLVVDPLSSLA